MHILHLAGRLKDEETVTRVFNTVRVVTQDSPSRTTYFALLNACFYARNTTKFLDVVNTMAAGGHKLGAVFTDLFARLCETPAQIDASIAHLVAQRERSEAKERAQEQQEQVQEQTKEVQEQEQDQEKPQDQAQEQAKAQGEEGAQQVQEEISPVSVDALSAVMRACAKAGDVERATGLFSACISDFKLMPDIESFNSVISTSILPSLFALFIYIMLVLILMS